MRSRDKFPILFREFIIYVRTKAVNMQCVSLTTVDYSMSLTTVDYSISLTLTTVDYSMSLTTVDYMRFKPRLDKVNS